jgi:catechol 2,3-dioxygenase-like lactoylglutathione lyase family enzyme
VEAAVNTTQTTHESSSRSTDAVPRDLKLEVVVLPVSDVDGAKRFYQDLGWRLDADFSNGADWHVVQMTPPGSPCSIQFGTGLTQAAPGSVQGTYLVVDDIEVARAELIGRGVEVGEVFHIEPGKPERLAGVDPEHRTYRSYASFSDPDGNGWLLQEITARLPGRGFSNLDVAGMTELLKETENRHGAYEPTAPKHHWSSWYAAYIVARERGKAPDDAAGDAARHTEAGLDRARV